MLLGCQLAPLEVTGRLIECCVSSFHISHTVPRVLPILRLLLSSALLLAPFYSGGGKVKLEEISCLFVGLFSDDELFLEFWEIRLLYYTLHIFKDSIMSFCFTCILYKYFYKCICIMCIFL